ncbi:MAG: diadenosine tetraphosphate hydrolase [Bacteroidetes bacterium 4572_77]|nr:MAG: diadenosine tetraphosphate hydrolase [Bacteroidetes bacterium 4572_77]
MPNFKDLKYLQFGNPKQKLAFRDLENLQIFILLKEFTPFLAGTIPIEIDIPESDLDIICFCKNHDEFRKQVLYHFQDQANFRINSRTKNGLESTIAHFTSTHFEIEIFAQSIPIEQQNAYKHMLIEHEILQKKGSDFRKSIIALKHQGYKTEVAFAKLLDINGDAFEELLKFEI